MRNKSFLAILAVILFLSGCAREPKDAKKTAEAQSQLAATPEQARLWKEAAEKAAAHGLEKVPLVERPVALRQRVALPERGVQPKPVQFPKELVAGVRVVSAPELADGQFSGAAQVARAEGEQLDLELAQRGMLKLHARAGGRPLRAKRGEKAQLDYRVKEDPFDRRLILAVRIESGDGVISVLESGRKPITVEIALFGFSATQVGKPERGTMSVEVRVGRERKVLAQGQIAEFPGSQLSVGLVSSIAYVGQDAYRVEGNPYAINLVAWPMP